jgi:hypothetical protein
MASKKSGEGAPSAGDTSTPKYILPDGYGGPYGPVGPPEPIIFTGNTAPPPGYVVPMSPIGPCWPPRGEALTISLAQLDALLKFHNYHNRPRRPAGVHKLRNAMTGQEWMLNGETMIIAWDGSMLDAQNRAYAAIESKVPLKIWVIFGINPDAFKTIDQGTKRTLSDHLSQLKVKNATMVAATIRTIYQYEEKGTRTTQVFHANTSSSEMLVYFGKHSGVEESATFGKTTSKVLPIPDRVLASTHYLFGLRDVATRDNFFQRLKSGANLYEADPILTLIKRIGQEQRDIAIAKDQRGKRLKATGEHLAYATMYGLIYTWNAVRGNRSVSKLMLPQPSENGGYTLRLPDID